MSQRADDILKLEYEALWRYYMRCQDECHRVTEFYLRAIAVPAGLVAALVTYLAQTRVEFLVYRTSIGAILLVIMAAGFAVLTVYVKENENSRRYLVALGAVRDAFRTSHPSLVSALIIDTLPKGDGLRTGSIGWWRSSILMIINAGLGTAAVAMFFLPMPDIVTFGAFVRLLIVQFIWARTARAGHTVGPAPVEPAAN